MIPPHSSSDYGDLRCAGSFAGAPRRLHSAGLLGPLRRRRRSSSSFFMISAKKMWEIFAKKYGARIAGGMPFLGVRLRRQAFVEGFTAQVDDSLNEIVLLPRRPLEELKAFRGPYGEDLVEDRGNFNVG